ncbi:hypothetical protein P3W45_000311 [Vairimorpha bombi]
MASELLKLYYRNFFPAEKLFQWLYITQYREISFCLENNMYVRNLMFAKADEFINRIQEKVPQKIDVGAVYDVIPIKNISKRAIEKELVFDIDLTDYDRTCCKDKIICDRCFPLIKLSVDLLNYILKDELGFESLSFVFSGRRGLHCWVNDKYTKKFNEKIRGDIVRYFDIVTEKKKYPEEYTKILMKYGSYMIDQGFATDLDNISIDILYDKMFLKLDREVAKSFNHLIKMPFSVHPDSQKISLPIDPDKLEKVSLNNMIGLKDVLNDPNLLLPYIRILDTWILK